MTIKPSYLRLRRHASNQLMMLWLRRDLRALAGRDTAVDIGCGRFINRPAFKTRHYVGVDNMPEFIEFGKNAYPDARGYVGTVLRPIPERGDIVVCTLVLNNKRFPHDRTIEAVDNLIRTVRPGGDLLFTLGHVNAPYEADVDSMLDRAFKGVEKRVYGRFNFPTYFSYPLAWLMVALPDCAPIQAMAWCITMRRIGLPAIPLPDPMAEHPPPPAASPPMTTDLQQVQRGRNSATAPTGFFRSLRPLWPLLAGYRWRTAGILALMFVAGLTEFVGLSMLIPLIGAAMGDLPAGSGMVGRAMTWLGATGFGLLPAAGLMIAAMLAKNVFSFVTVWQRMRLSLELRNRWAERIFDGALRAPLATLSRQRTGELVEAVSSETQKAGNAVVSLLDAIRRLILAVILIVGLLATAPLLMFAVSSVIALVLLTLHWLHIFRSIDEGKEMLDYSRDIANITAESMAQVRQIKLIDAYAERRETLIGALHEFARVRTRFETVSQIPTLTIELTMVILIAGGFTFGIYYFPYDLRGTLPTLAMFIVVTSRLVSTVGSLFTQIMKLNVGLANIGYVAERLGNETQAESLDAGEPFPAVKSALELDRVTFSWPGGMPVLVEANMSFPRGQVTAIIGASGRGKSTVAAMLCGLLLPDAGAVRADGAPLSRFNLRSLRRSVGYVTQEVELFHGTVADNVRMGRPEATQEEVAAACRLAHADDFIAALPMGYQTLVGERGASLSGGQRQRLALARALVGRRSIYIFDEATSALDEETQSRVQETINALRQDAVVVVVAHRPSAIRHADRVYRLEENGSAMLLSPEEISLAVGDVSAGIVKNK